MNLTIDPNRVIEKYRSQLMAANEKNAVLEAAVDQLTEKNAELMHLLRQTEPEVPSHTYDGCPECLTRKDWEQKQADQEKTCCGPGNICYTCQPDM